MTTGEKVIAALKAHVGERETHGPNRSPFIDKINRAAGVPLGSPWCGSIIRWAWFRAGMHDAVARIASASTWFLVERGRAAGRLRHEPVRGCAVVWNPGSNGHTEVFDSWFDKAAHEAWTIGGNTGDAVRFHRRSVRGAFFVVPAELDAGAARTFEDLYLLEDREAKPEFHGWWFSKNAVTKAERAWKAANPHRRGQVRRMKRTRAHPATGRRMAAYGFLTGARRWRGPWVGSGGKDSKRARAASIAAQAKLEGTLGRRLRRVHRRRKT